MNPALEARLRAEAPNFYGRPVPGHSLDTRGFECGDGWFDILLGLGRDCDRSGVWVSSVKEKFGRLTIYCQGEVPDWVQLAIDEAEEESVHVCMDCGARGELRKSGNYVYVSCDSHVRPARSGPVV